MNAMICRHNYKYHNLIFIMQSDIFKIDTAWQGIAGRTGFMLKAETSI